MRREINDTAATPTAYITDKERAQKVIKTNRLQNLPLAEAVSVEAP